MLGELQPGHNESWSKVQCRAVYHQIYSGGKGKSRKGLGRWLLAGEGHQGYLGYIGDLWGIAHASEDNQFREPVITIYVISGDEIYQFSSLWFA